MQDRVPVDPGRVLITPENGNAAFYATMTRADNPTKEGTPLNKNTLLKDSTAALFGFDEKAVPDEVFAEIIGRFSEMKLRPAINAELGPYDIDDANYVCDGNGEGYQKYVTLLARENPGYNSYDGHFKYRPWVCTGRYSYACESYYSWSPPEGPVHRAYRLDHLTKQAELLCDISNQASTDYSGKQYDTILAVDDKYVYFARNDAYDSSDDEYDVTLMKFDHAGTLVSSKAYPYSSGQMQQWDAYIGFGGSDIRPITYPGTSEYSGIYQTKNYIVLMLCGSARSTGSPASQHVVYRLINKNTLAITNLYSGNYASYQFGTRFAVYDKDLLYILGHYTSVGNSYAYCSRVFNLASPATSLNDDNSLDDVLSCTVAGVSRYAVGVEAQINNINGYSYYLMKFCSDSQVKKDISYAVVRSDAFSTSTGSFSTAYSLTTAPDFGYDYYDPVEDKVHHNGLAYEVYPSYVPPVEVVEVHKKFTATPFFRTDGYLYFLRKADNRVYRLKDKTYYLIDRVEVRE